jgi:threonine dehydrogenase-like Zn-dependent dehydrogenase
MMGVGEMHIGLIGGIGPGATDFYYWRLISTFARRIVMLGEGGRVEFNPSPDIIHDQKTIFGSWVTSTWLMDELVERLVRWNLHPEDLVTHRFELDRVGDAYALMASGECGKVAVCFDEELKGNSRR